MPQSGRAGYCANPARVAETIHTGRLANFLDVCPLRFRPISPNGRAWSANVLRGAFGSVLKRLDAQAYTQFFTPAAGSFSSIALLHNRPSGLRDLPRPFVFRLRDGEIGINLFLTSAVDLVCRVMSELDFEAKAPEVLRLPLDAAPSGSTNSGAQHNAAATTRLHIRFLTPTELKGSLEPEFAPLVARIRDRISTIRTLYGAGPLDLDFRDFGDRARLVRMTRCELQSCEENRVSRRTGQKHSIGGFTGFAEYQGPAAEFLPYLEAARWTGVGRQTVWGKGEIAVERIEHSDGEPPDD